jgi:hypothetical protein
MMTMFIGHECKSKTLSRGNQWKEEEGRTGYQRLERIEILYI